MSTDTIRPIVHLSVPLPLTAHARGRYAAAGATAMWRLVFQFRRNFTVNLPAWWTFNRARFNEYPRNKHRSAPMIISRWVPLHRRGIKRTGKRHMRKKKKKRERERQTSEMQELTRRAFPVSNSGTLDPAVSPGGCWIPRQTPVLHHLSTWLSVGLQIFFQSEDTNDNGQRKESSPLCQK